MLTGCAITKLRTGCDTVSSPGFETISEVVEKVVATAKV